MLFGVVILSGLLIFWWFEVFPDGNRSEEISTAPQTRTFQTAQLGEQQLEVVLSETAREHQQGLSRQPSIGSDGMLFVFSQPQQPVFWMNEMRFALDFIWIANGRVVDLHENVPYPEPHDSEIRTVQPSVPVDFVLEVPAGFIQRFGITMGTPFALTGKPVDKTWESSKLLQE